MDYRKRMYDGHPSSRRGYTDSARIKEYEYLRRIYRRRFMRFLPEDKEARIIDLACGSGRFIYFLQKEGYHRAQGVDLNQKMIDLAREMGVENVEVGDLFQILPHHKEEFDFISANDIIEHLRREEILEFLDLVYAALKPGCSTLMTTPNMAALFGGMAGLGVFHEVAFTPKSLARVFQVCGFEHVKVYGEEPVTHSLLSGVRAVLWKFAKAMLRAYLLIQGSTGFGMWKGEVILEPRIFVVGRKP